MPVAGTVDTATLTLDTFGPDTTAALRVVDPLGAVTTPDVFPVDLGPELVGKQWRALVPLPIPGIWRECWTVAGAGEGVVAPVLVAVGPAPDGVDPRRSYATTVDLANYLRDAPPVDAERRLRDATARIDGELLCAVYDVDDAGMPTDAVVAAAMRDAVCAVVKWWDEIGEDGSGASLMLSSASIAGVSLGWSRGSGSAPPDLVGDEARRHLAEAGLLGRGPWSY